jgi:hypothetical protein
VCDSYWILSSNQVLENLKKKQVPVRILLALNATTDDNENVKDKLLLKD